MPLLTHSSALLDYAQTLNQFGITVALTELTLDSLVLNVLSDLGI